MEIAPPEQRWLCDQCEADGYSVCQPNAMNLITPFVEMPPWRGHIDLKIKMCKEGVPDYNKE